MPSFKPTEVQNLRVELFPLDSVTFHGVLPNWKSAAFIICSGIKNINNILPCPEFNI